MSNTVSHLEDIKAASRHLRGTIEEGLNDPVTGAISDDDNKLLKFHGSYQQDDRDIRDERRRRKLEPAYAFMVRARLPGGVVTPAQWLAFDDIARGYATRGLRITTRQTFQWHGIIKRNLKPTLQAINQAMATTIAACGDVNRQVVSSVNPLLSGQHRLVQEWTNKLSDHFIPRTRAYHEIWLDGEKLTGEPEEEPIYGSTYLPRKFKIGVAIPPTNDIDVFAQDLGLIAIIEKGKLLGFNVAIGGGMGATHGDDSTYARLGSLIGFVPPEQVIATAEGVVTLQRDYGNRIERQHARLKYTIDHRGLDWFKQALEERIGFALQPLRPYHFDQNGDRYGWQQGEDGRWHLGLDIESGRLWDVEGKRLQTGVREIAKILKGEFRMTCNQNLVIANVDARDRQQIDALVAQYGLDGYKQHSGIRQHTIACVALPTCGLAMAESERYAPILLPKLEALLSQHGLADAPIVLRLSGCPNGCSRPYLAEIALIGRALGRYDLRLGADFTGQRLNTLYRENIDEAEILSELDSLFAGYARERQGDEKFGDFLIRSAVIPPPTQKLIPIRLDTVTLPNTA
ncbi:assimilatory sulfite reductase (NADPH) hemoprotein subunit [Pollutimonas thiosulfatoxidans]|uniref:Sulfite reductase [NADPH] hemoprotein beta-component n=1 Tax=Pollutimonas thiosulfatoxidans TaxID=2028345 RepID=A0A410GCD5_9BURK|nr:assimilatory sulfite reductase (NADPH) hemoprotein subunit [Pollutimonas thiosulfatoxidans]MBF6617998.1 assimilatory sulfite reductase (NADPH) hemoprotein subunit [Candidimonas sp.]QAA93967.1 assimilatory sulfite reductase (NADPH) hemoprotein subunit [Pollutimonas thiosulfatoxidans]